MKAAIFVRMAAGLVLLHAVLHTVGGLFGKVPAGPAAVAVAAMKANPFVVFGNTRTFWDFYMGFGLGVTIFLTMEAVVLWLLAPLTVAYGEKLRPVLTAFAIGYLVFAVNSYRYFFLGPVVAEVLIAGCLFAAVATLRGGEKGSSDRAASGG
jgi:hypothetical protein